MIYYESDYLMHHGVKGQKWGRRKQRVLKGRTRQAGLTRAGQRMGRVSNAYTRVTVRRAGARVGRLAGMAAGIGMAGVTASILKKHGKLSIGSAAGLAAVPIGTTIVGGIIGGNAARGAVAKRQAKF